MKITEKTAFNLFLKSQSFIAESGRDLILSKETRRNIFYCVVAGHLFFFILPFIMDYIQKMMTPKKLPIVTVKLFEEPKNLLPPKQEPSKPEIPKQEPTKQQEPPKPTPPPEPPKIPAQPKPEPKAQPKIVEKKTVPKKTEPLKPIEKPKWTPIDPKQIKKSTEVVKRENTPAIDTKSLKEKLKQTTNSIKTIGPIGPQVTSKSDIEPADYYDKVSAYLYEMWKQPSKMELKGARPTVLVSISIDATGRILSKFIKTKSMNQAMDASVEELLNQLTSLPSPPSGAISFDVSLEIRD